jgi:hypothetical protein
MSDDLWFTTLRWTHGAGVAKLHNREVALREKPDLGFEFEELVYRPEHPLARIRLQSGATRELLPHEIAACDRFLRGMVL